MCEERLAPLLSMSETLSDEDATKLGKKEPEQEVRHPSFCLSLSLSFCLCLCTVSTSDDDTGVCVCVSRWRSSWQPTLRSSVKTSGSVL